MLDQVLAHEAQVRYYALIAAFGGIAAWEALAPRMPVAAAGARWRSAALLAVLGSVLAQFIIPVATVGLAGICAAGDANRNFAALFNVWDRMFGSYAGVPTDRAALHFGLAETAGGRHYGLGWLLALPLRRLGGTDRKARISAA